MSFSSIILNIAKSLQHIEIFNTDSEISGERLMVILTLLLKSVNNKKRYDSELPYQRPDLIEVMEIEIDLTTSTNVHTGFYISVRECLD